MSLVIDAQMLSFTRRMGITKMDFLDKYALSNVDDIIESEAASGNKKAEKSQNNYSKSVDELIYLFSLNDSENKYALFLEMDPKMLIEVLKLMEPEDLNMGFYFFTQEKLLDMLNKIDIEELVPVMLEAFSLEKLVSMMNEKDLMQFFLNDKIEKEPVTAQLRQLPRKAMIRFVECVTGRPYQETDPNELINNISMLPVEDFRKFMAVIDPMVQQNVVYQMAKEEPKYLTLFDNTTYTRMLEQLQKPDMIKPMVALPKETMIEMLLELPQTLLSITATQVDTEELAYFIKDNAMDLLETALVF